ncbi:DUF6463 family protein [Scytonema millei]|uniref:Uncharacterized protein n=1 Tax=Scytonema millei VB511283 TaxID=1245923 RepID=A0A9X5E2S9_9CYAN|nr:DUF6463 family protein [Scytonema millei]NHC33723.1 hypothetical protein [Scytonema millei VB511283]
MLRLSGYWLYATSIIHVLVGLWLYAEPLSNIARSGFFNAVDPFCDRNTAFWFLMVVPLLFAMGQLCCWAQIQSITLPNFLGWCLLVTALVGIFLMPISGFWLLIPPSVLIIITSHQSKSNTTSISYKA